MCLKQFWASFVRGIVLQCSRLCFFIASDRFGTTPFCTSCTHWAYTDGSKTALGARVVFASKGFAKCRKCSTNNPTDPRATIRAISLLRSSCWFSNAARKHPRNGCSWATIAGWVAAWYGGIKGRETQIWFKHVKKNLNLCKERDFGRFGGYCRPSLFQLGSHCTTSHIPSAKIHLA